MKDTAITITFDRFPYAFSALGMDDRQREIFAMKVHAGSNYYTPRIAALLAKALKEPRGPSGLRR
jgi:hypothetical protein